MKKICLLGMLLLAGCKPECSYDYVVRQGYTPQSEKDIFLECLSRSHVDSLQGAKYQGWDDVIDNCHRAASNIVWEYRKSCPQVK